MPTGWKFTREDGTDYHSGTAVFIGIGYAVNDEEAAWLSKCPSLKLGRFFMGLQKENKVLRARVKAMQHLLRSQLKAAQEVVDAAEEMVTMLADHGDYFYPRCKGWPNDCHACADVAQFVCQALSKFKEVE